ncbi:DUF6083 domain-containing protein [Streptomyces sp. PSKA30]|uniref:DUF6083 domain-containing protein n=1 Tax=Streptomyces sp. PSKA30 TaxID=2874597 RepID=UPI001CD18CE6|nr:DUF6083 domain-containing protein [Streptomyces sp. PSKA30]MBZ9643831.1 hypothetical protein [Streptomyces sp. PSKA30]
MALLCERCWKAYADEIAIQEGATDTPRPEPDPDDVTPYEPPRCPHCKAEVSPYLTNYDRWVHLATRDYPAKDVPPRYRWRLVAVLARHSSVPTGSVAVRVRGIEPLPSDLVRPAHRAVCLSPDAVDEVEQEPVSDL